jgi:hypothetical protein
VSAELATVSFRTESGVDEDEPWTAVDGARLSSTVPWRTFRWYAGQKHYSCSYWSAVMRDHVIYESRLELSRLLFADFDRPVQRILAQPFLLKARVEGKIRKHIPDYLLVTDGGPVVVDVKPRHVLARPKVAFTFAWTRQLVEARGWRFEVWSEPHAHELENLRFLAGYLRPWLFDAVLLDQVRDADGGAGRSARWSVACRSTKINMSWGMRPYSGGSLRYFLRCGPFSPSIFALSSLWDIGSDCTGPLSPSMPFVKLRS